MGPFLFCAVKEPRTKIKNEENCQNNLVDAFFLDSSPAEMRKANSVVNLLQQENSLFGGRENPLDS